MSEVVEIKSNPSISIEEEMRQSYLSYAMSVIVSRALPDVRDGLKPVHRRILYAQHELGNEWNRSYKKSARIVGDVMGKYHPHGDSAIYDALVRMAQDFSMRLPLEDGQGNFGSMDGDKAAAMRYTEVRMSRASHYMLSDIEKDTVDFRPNYDGNDQEPSVLPTRIPNVLVNGSSGIAVGMATNIPPHNLGEVVDATVYMVDNPECDTEHLLEFIKGPDFPTGGIALGLGGIRSAAQTGRGSVVVRAKTHNEEFKEGRTAIVVTEVPYQVNKAKMIERIAELVRDKVIDGISDLRDESDREGVRVVIELRRDANPEVVLSQLYKNTPMQSSFGTNLLALDRGRPRLMGYKQVLQCFVKHREEVITRRTRFDLRKARDRAHVLVGLAIAVANIDEIIRIIRNAPDPATAKRELMERNWATGDVLPLIELLGEYIEDSTVYKLSETQAQAILDLRLHRLTGLERDKINAEANEIAEVIRKLVEILSDRGVLLGILKEELLEIKERFANERRTEIREGDATVNLEDLITPEDVVVTISTDGYVKRQPMDAFRAQRRGGKGRSLSNMKDEEQIETFFVANTHDQLLYFTSTGKVYKMKVYEIPASSVQARGKAFINLLPLEKDERVLRVLPTPKDVEDWEGLVAMFATAKGLIRKTPLKAFANVHSSGIKGMALNEGDSLVDIHLCPEDDGDILLSSKHGQAVRFPSNTLRTIGSRTALGVKGMTLKGDDEVISMHVVKDEDANWILSVTKNGYGKRTPVDDFPIKSRGTMGVIAIKTSERNGEVVTSMPVCEGDDVMLLTSDGQVIRTHADDISIVSRNTQGVRLFKVDGNTVYSVVRIPAEMMVEDELEEGSGEISEDSVPVEAIAEAVESADVTEEVTE